MKVPANWLVIGGAGYIGSHSLRELISKGNKCVVLDNLSKGIKERVPKDVELIIGEAADSELIINICKRLSISRIVHFAAFMQARESVRRPIKYWDNNLSATFGIIRALSELDIKEILFSSSCSVYGNNTNAVTDSNLNPLSPYAMTKVACEQILEEACLEHGIGLTILRYFNVIGCGDFKFSIDASTETLIPTILNSIKSKQPIQIFGNKFDSIDGTPIRDYVDVRDLARAHWISTFAKKGKNPLILNVSSGSGSSVKQLVEIMSSVSGIKIEIEYLPPKPGDPGVISAKTSQELLDLNWIPQIPIEQSLTDHWNSFRTENQETGSKLSEIQAPPL